MKEVLHDEQFLLFAKTIVSQAQRTIDISTYKIEMASTPRGRPLLEFFKTLYDKRKQGITIRFMAGVYNIKHHTPYSNAFAREELKKNNIRVRHLYNNRCCHAKVMIVDNTVAILGSHNLSVKSCHNNFEVSYIDNDPLFIKRLACIYNRVWDKAHKG